MQRKYTISKKMSTPNFGLKYLRTFKPYFTLKNIQVEYNHGELTTLVIVLGYVATISYLKILLCLYIKQLNYQQQIMGPML